METTTVHLNNRTKLKDRTLWFDGDVTVNENEILNFISHCEPSKLCVDNITSEIKQYNSLLSPELQIKQKKDLHPLNTQWNIPNEYSSLKIEPYILNKLMGETDGMNQTQTEVRIQRVQHELSLYKKYNLLSMLRTLVYLIDTLTKNKVLWGIGRGSSVSSYVLYLLGIHDIDSVEYDLNIHDFLS